MLANHPAILLTGDMKASKKGLTDAQLDEVAKLFAVMADGSRLRILQRLMEREQTVTELIESTGLNQANLSKHLGLLHLHKFVERRKDGNFAVYSIKDPTVAKLCELMCGRIGREAERLVKILEGYSI
jgi:DNA-binding transcriptional ArsR family regulator